MEYVLIVWEQSIPGFIATPRTFLSWPEAWSPDLLEIISSLVTFQKIKWNHVSSGVLCVHCLGQTGPPNAPDNGVTLLMKHVAEQVRTSHAGFPQGLENRENRGKNNGQGKVREF